MEAFASYHQIPIEWAEKGVRKQDDLEPPRRRMEKANQYGVYFILKSMEQGSTFRSTPKQYEKFSTFLRNELCSNNLTDFGLKKGLEHLVAVRQKFLQITDRFATFQAQALNVHIDFPLLQRLALPVTRGTVHFPGSKIHDTRLIL